MVSDTVRKQPGLRIHPKPWQNISGNNPRPQRRILRRHGNKNTDQGAMYLGVPLGTNEYEDQKNTEKMK